MPIDYKLSQNNKLVARDLPFFLILVYILTIMSIAFSPESILISYPQYVFFFISCILFISEIIRKNIKIHFDLVVAFFYLSYLYVGITSFWCSLDLYYSNRLMLIIFITSVIIYIFSLNLKVIHHLTIAKIFSIYGGVITIIGLILFFNGDRINILGFHLSQLNYQFTYERRISSLFGNPNSFGSLLIFSTPLTLFLATTKKKSFYFIILIIQYSAIIFTLSRSTWMGILIATICYSIFYIRFSKPRNILLKLLLLVFISYLLLVVLDKVYEYNSGAPLFDVIKPRSSISGILAGRDIVWAEDLKIVMRNPIWGIGFGNSQWILGKDLGSSGAYSAHSLYLGLAGELGIPFVILGVLFWGFFIVRTIIHINNIQTITVRLLQASLLSIIVGFFIQQIGEFQFMRVSPFHYFIVMAMGLMQNIRKYSLIQRYSSSTISR